MFRLNQVSQLGDAASADRDTAIYQTACNTPRQDALDSSKGEALTDVDPNRPFRTSECQLRCNSRLGEPSAFPANIPASAIWL